ncbi:OmpA family protein [Rhizobacter sp. Root1221]|uniref:OmpA family protein n=1 Tax=Rhizobacter sp. Root1221 TaxID=1736433 RepID=UPI0006FBDA99|nr:OmpA family protein [Rhizobacter sp. Root1221]KQV96908.1 hypothetical protein ASC87_24610 [Rhizobacter sp. Root1221]
MHHHPDAFTLFERFCMNRPFRRAALSSAAAAACLTLGAAVAQPADTCAADARGRFSDRCEPDRRAVEIDGTDRVPETSERELPKLTFLLGDDRSVTETRVTVPARTVPGTPVERTDTHTPRFDSGEDLLKPADRARLDAIVAQVKGREQLRFEIVGHTDVQRISPRLRPRFPDNQALGLGRAQQVGRYLTAQLGLPDTAFTAQSRGPDEPVATPRENTANWPANRRVEVRVYWRDPVVPAVAPAPAVVAQVDPTECHMLTPYAGTDGPLRLTIDGKPEVGADSSSADRQRCIDVRLEHDHLRLQYDSLSQPRRLNAAAWPTTVVPGDTVQFLGYSNYRLFARRAELRVFVADDTLQPRLLAAVRLRADWRATWEVPADLTERKLFYRVRVYDADGRFDETGDFTLTVAGQRPPSDVPATDGAAERQLMTAYGDSRIAIANIPIQGGTVTASGDGIRTGQTVRALGFDVPVDPQGRFVFQQLVPRRVQTGEIAVADLDGTARVYRRDFEIPKQDWFVVGQADVTVGRNHVDGPAALVTQDTNRQRGDTWAEGRFAFYGKGLLDDRWTLTGSVDTEERPFNELLRNLDRKDATSLFRRLDPADSWATFGDDSTSIDDAPTQGRIYLKVDDGRSHAMWGNFKLNLDDTQLAQVSRGLYGAHGRYVGDTSTDAGDARLRADVYAAEPGSLAAREEFRGTGGSLYYLRHQDLTRGAEKVFVEVRDRDSGLVLSRRQLVPSSDYEIDYLQGRVLLASPLASLADDSSLVRAGGLAGLPAYLVVDYEYVPFVSSLDTLATGGRVAWWATDAVRVGVTASRQKQTGGDQRLGGVDVTVRQSDTRWVKAEVARSEGPGTGQLTSSDGGFAFDGQALGTDVKANAWRVEGQTDVAGTGRVGAYAQHRDAGFSGPGQLAANETQQAGVSAALPVGERTELRVKADRRDETNGFDTDAAEVQLGHTLSPQWKLGATVRHDSKRTDALVTNPLLPSNAVVQGERTDAALQAEYTGAGWSGYVFGQQTVGRTGSRRSNDRGGVGGRYRVSDKFAVNGEASGGDGGLAGKAGAEYQYDDRSSVYTTYVLDTGRTDENVTGRGGSLVSGVKSRVADGLNVYTEHRHTTGQQPGLTHAYGVQYAPDPRWTFGASFENGRIGSETLGELDREAAALTAGYSSDTVRYSGGAEYRTDRSRTEERRSWLLKNAISVKADRDSRWIGKLNWADSNSSTGALAAAKYTEAVAGYAFRPVANDRFNVLLKYTYLYDLSSPGQVLATEATQAAVSTTGIDYQQRSHVAAIDATYDLTERWTVGGKYARRTGELRASRDDSAPWFRSTADLMVLRIDWKVLRRWDALAEVRSLRARELGDRRDGLLTAGYYHVNENFKVGVGYNFTDFSDDLTDLSYRSRGWFLNMLGKF